MKFRKRVAVVALVALLVVSAGCLGLGIVDSEAASANETTEAQNSETTDVQENETAEEYDNATAVQEAATDAMADVDSYTFTMEMTMESENFTMVSQSEGAADAERQRLRQNQSVVMTSAEGQNLTVNSSSYLIGNTMYTSYEGQSWQTMNISEMPGGMDADNVWNQSSQVQQQQDLLNASNVSFGDEKTTTVNGQEVYVVVLDIDGDEFQNATMQGANGEMQRQSAQSNVQYGDISVTQYVATDSMRIIQTEMTVEMTANGDTVRQEMVMTFGDFNEDVTIEPPVETNETAA